MSYKVILDLSQWQQDPDFAQIAQQFNDGKIAGVILRVQHGYTHPDTKYAQYVAACKQYGIPFGTYAYAAPVSVNDAIAEANTSFQRMDKDSKCFAVDIEEKDCPDIVAAGQAYVDRLHALGVKNVGKYSYTGFYNTNKLDQIKADWTWIASYGVDDGVPHVQPNVAGMDLWQFTSTAHVNGIATNVDESVITDPDGFPFFDLVAPAPKPMFAVKVLNPTDVRTDPNHAAGYVGNVSKDQIYNVWQTYGYWCYIILDEKTNTCGWADSDNGNNLWRLN